MNVLSLFDGMSCGRIALERAGIQVNQYYASELDKYAIKVTQANWPETIQLGDVTKWREWDIDWSSIDLLIGGSPCQGFSFAGKQLAFDDPRSKLFFVYSDILTHIDNERDKAGKTEVKFLLENVKMKKEFLEIISDHLGVKPVFINSALVSAQNRQRYYWANWDFEQPEDKGLVLADIVECSVDLKYQLSEKLLKGFENKINRRAEKKSGFDKFNVRPLSEKVSCLTARYYKTAMSDPFIEIRSAAMVGRKLDENGKQNDSLNTKAIQCLEVNSHGKSRCISTVSKDSLVSDLPPGRHIDYERKSYRKLTPIECERLQTVAQHIKPVEIVLCLDQAKSFVSAVEKNPKLLKLVSSAGNEELKECVKLASQNMNANQASKKLTVHPSVGMQTHTQTKKCTKANQDAQSLTASNAEDITTFRQVESAESSVIQSVFINITEGKITHFGREESPQIGQSYTEQMNGKIALKLSGKETMQNASDALSALETMQTNSHSTSITSFRLSTKNLEQMLIISYWFAKNATGGFTQDTISKKALYLNLIDGYTNHVSNTQRYKMLGNGWTVDVIAHIFTPLASSINLERAA